MRSCSAAGIEAGNFFSGSARGESSGFWLGQLLDLFQSFFEQNFGGTR